MAITVSLNSHLFEITNEWTVSADGGTLGAILDDLDARYPGFKSAVCGSETNRVRSAFFVTIGDTLATNLDAVVTENVRIEIKRRSAGG